MGGKKACIDDVFKVKPNFLVLLILKAFDWFNKDTQQERWRLLGFFFQFFVFIDVESLS